MRTLKICSQSFDDLIWAVRVDAWAWMLAVQLRNPERKQASYCMVDMETGAIGPLVTLENGWWTELQEVQRTVLLIGRYGDPALPVITERVAVDGQAGKVIENYVPRQHEEISDARIPTHSLADTDNLAPALAEGSSLATLKQNPWLVRAWHGNGESGLEHWLEVVLEDEVVLRTCLDHHMQKLNPAPFFVAGRWLVFIRERKELCWVDLG